MPAVPGRTSRHRNFEGEPVLRSRRSSRSRSRTAGLVGMAVAFARSPQGQRLILEARRRYDTPENRARLRQALRDLQARSGRARRR